MGFFDKIMKKVGATLATRYGVVSGGKYEGCKIAMGNPPTEKVTAANSFSQMIFLKENEEVARLNIAREIIDVAYTETIQFPETGADGYRCTITFADGDTCQFDLFPSRARVFYSNLKGLMLKETDEFFKETIKNMTQA